MKPQKFMLTSVSPERSVHVLPSSSVKAASSPFFTIFVRPGRQGQGIGRKIVETLEADEFALRARRIEIPASITALPFYQKMGYTFKPGHEEPDEELIYRLEKYR